MTEDINEERKERKMHIITGKKNLRQNMMLREKVRKK
jgi:hypothetical protein